jgi:hypothetical protein
MPKQHVYNLYGDTMKSLSFLKTALVLSAFAFLSACAGGGNAQSNSAGQETPQISEDDAQAQLTNAKDEALGAATTNHELRKEIFKSKKELGIDTDVPEPKKATKK